MTRTATIPYHTERNFFFVALSFFLTLFGLYIYFISASVIHVIARKEIDQKIARVNSHIGEFESTYIAAKQAITPDTIAQYGFVAASPSKIYVQKAPTNLVLLTHNEN
jgi:hypothetical protein